MSHYEQNIQVRLVVGEGYLASIGEQIERAGGAVTENATPYDPPPDEADDYAGARVESLMLIAAKLSVAMLIRLISETLWEHRRLGGQIIDARGQLTVCRPAPFLEHGMVVVVTTEDFVVYEPEQKTEALEALKALFDDGALV